MGKREDFNEYLVNLKDTVEAAFPGRFIFKGVNDRQIVQEWFDLEIPNHLVPLILSDLDDEGRLPRIFSFSDVNEEVKEGYKRYSKKEATEAAGRIKEETIPYKRIESLAKILRSILLEAGIRKYKLIKELEKLKESENLVLIEEKLSEMEEAFYQLLSEKYPECKKIAEKKVSPYKFYWHPKIYEITLKAVEMKCLKEKFKVPDFTIL
ncbi:hypothetical protein SAMN06265339_0063 [Desulfurobacterium pacificum]|jgi:hypothetical protein|uniref:Uncharacterized protein n=1 Tax=Desulfurobacterium pacificum TaxID=240166 RepID=A0ABY1N7N5_9BACT|nr:hypothetical protein [Desulfurobacterium pacificum]SMP02640.1 hypothetical protein SAMN06265339_0063 [Desulfurobacterium pacificum]